MGLIRDWFEKRRVQKAVSTLMRFKGKDRAELARQGGWEIVAGNDWSWLSTNWNNANQIWKQYSDADLEIAYAIASTIYACIRLKATTAKQAWLEIGQWTKKGWIEVEDHWVYDLMRRPNGGQDTAGFIWEFVSHADTTGWSYVWKLRNRGGGIMAIQPLPTSWIRRVYNDRSGMLEYYEVRRWGSAGAESIKIKPEDMFYMKYPNPNDPTQAAGPLGAALRDLQVDDARQDLLIEMLSNIHFPGAIMKRETGWLPDDKEEARRVLRDVIGPGSRANPLFVDGIKTEVELPSPPKDMDWPGTAIQAETRICSAFGIPPILVHFRAGLEHATYANYAEARRSFYQDTMRSLWEMMASSFERGLLIDEGEEQLEMEPNFDSIPEMQEDEGRRHGRIRDDFHGGLLKWNEAVELVGGEPLPGQMGEVYVMPMNLQQVAVSNEPGGEPMAAQETEVESEDEDDEHLENADVEDEEVTDDNVDDADDDTEEAVGKTSSLIIAKS